MDYKILSQDEMDDIITSYVLSQERDEFCHSLNLARYNQMLVGLPEGEWKAQIIKLRDQTEKRLAEVRSIIQATQSQLPPAERLEASKTRLQSAKAIIAQNRLLTE